MGSFGSKAKKNDPLKENKKKNKFKKNNKNNKNNIKMPSQQFIPPPPPLTTTTTTTTTQQQPCNVELEAVFDNEHLPRPNVKPLTHFERDELNKAKCNDYNPCDTFQKIDLPPPDYYGKIILTFFCLNLITKL